ncbi:MAG: hypothetical protein LBU16_08715 [Treponema sp.]|nr:hypothetical protein [Treponema sp.]
MSGVKKLGATALIVLFALNSCTDFFTTSWGEMFRRDPKNVRVTASNVYDLLDAAKGDRELSRAILDKINADSDPALKRAAIKAANQAAGLSTAMLENVSALIDAADKKDSNALKDLAEKIKNEIKANDVEGIGDKMTGILAGEKGEIKHLVPSEEPRAALINAGGITVSVPKTNGTGTSTITIDNVGRDGKGTATITAPDGTKTRYDCEIKDDETITLKDRNSGKETDIQYTVNNNNTVTLTDLEQIPNAGLQNSSNPSEEPLPAGKPEFKDGFIDDSISESDLTLLVMTLILAKVEKKEKAGVPLDDYLEEWTDPKDPDTTKDVKTGAGLDDDELLIASIVNFMIDRGDDMSELTNMIKDLLGVK